MLGNYVTCTHVVSSVTLYRSAVVDLSRSRAVHAVEHDPCCPDPVRLQGATCQAVHYGLCSPLLKLPPFVIPPNVLVSTTKNAAKTPTPPSTPVTAVVSPTTSVSGPPSTNPGLVIFSSKENRASPVSSPISSPVSAPNSPKFNLQSQQPPSLIPSGPELPLNLISGFDPVTLLAAADLEGQLEALVTSFVARDKSRLAARGSRTPDVTPNPNNNAAANQTNSSADPKAERRIIRRPGVEVVAGKLVPVSSSTSPTSSPSTSPNRSPSALSPSPEYRRDGGGVKAQIDRFAPRLNTSSAKPDDQTGVNKDRLSRQPSPDTPISSDKAATKNPSSQDGGGAKRVVHVRHNPERVINPVQQTVLQTPYTSGVRNGLSATPAAIPDKRETDADWLREEEEKSRGQRTSKASSPERTSGGADSPTIPHPKLTTAQRQHMKERSMSPTDRNHSLVPLVRPFLAKGSVAERVLLFERCPSLERSHQAIHPGSNHSPYPSTTGLASSGTTGSQGLTGPSKASSFYGALKGAASDYHSKTQVHSLNNKDKENQEPGLKTGSLRRLPKTATRATHNIPRFYYPNGKPLESSTIDETIKKIANVFASLGNNRRVANFDQFGLITKACGLPLYCKAPLFQACGGGSIKNAGVVPCDSFLDFWRRILTTCHEEASRFIRILSRVQRNYIIPEDFVTMIQDMIDTHPGLTFLKEAPEFHSRYVHTVIARIFYCVNRSWTGKITVAELRKSNFLQVLKILEEEEDINQITEYFSYEHFYVIYCKFWELDKDHDLFIDKADLSRHNDGAISSRMIERIFSGAVTRGPVLKQGKMSYSEFVWFLISEEDKRHPRSIEYWFRCVDIDGDGFLSMYELEYFYDEQLHRMEALGIETLPFKDCLCQMLDMIRPKIPGKISLSDLKKCKMTPVFFDTFFNLEKYLDHEQRDPFASQRDHEDGLDISDWDRYAAEEYELLVSEESEQQEDLMYEDYDDGDLPVSINFDNIIHQGGTGGMSEPMNNRLSKSGGKNIRPTQQIINDLEDEDYDYADSDADYHY